MPGHYDFKKEWEKTRGQLVKISQEAIRVAKKGEKELLEFSHKSKLHVDTTAINLKKEKLYYLIGKEYAHAKDPQKPTAKLAKLIHELDKANKQQIVLKRKLKRPKKSKKSNEVKA